MKMKMFTMLAVLSLGTTAVFAQKGVEDGSRLDMEKTVSVASRTSVFILNT